LTKDLAELHNIYEDPAAQPVVAELKKELMRLKSELGDKDQFAKNGDWPKIGVDSPFGKKDAGKGKAGKGKKRGAVQSTSVWDPND
jgi:hypothetical protein